MKNPSGWMERTQHFLKKCVAHMARGESVLVHCKHGIRRTGSFITLLLSMLLMMSFRSVMSLTSTMPTWTETIKIAWEFWAAQHGLQSRATSRHDYYQESWTAFQKYYGETSWECLEEIYAAVASAFLEVVRMSVSPTGA